MVVLLSAQQWCERYGFSIQSVILDPDGWRRKDGVELHTPIEWYDFLDRLRESTVNVVAWDFLEEMIDREFNTYCDHS